MRGLTRVSQPFDSVVSVPGSKSLTLRALACAALAEGRSHLYSALQAEDGEAMIRVLRGFAIEVSDNSDPWAVDGTGGHLQTPAVPLDVGESGLTLRIGLVLAALADGETTISGRGSISRRPVRPLLDVLEAQGVSVGRGDGGFPIVVGGHGGLWGGDITIDSSVTTQFATALLLAAPVFTEPTNLRLDGLAGSRAYLDATTKVMGAFGAEINPTITGYEVGNGGYRTADYQVEPDASTAVYPLVAAAMTGSRVTVSGLSLESAQPDMAVPRLLAGMGCRLSQDDDGLILDARDAVIRPVEADLSESPDGALAVAVLCLFAGDASRLTGLGSLRHKESDRIASLTAGLRGLGASVEAGDEFIVIHPGELRGAEIDPHGDHRVAMALALAGLLVDGVLVTNPDVVDKTWPGYWETMETMTAT